MIFDAQGLPTESGATSFGDSARLGGLLAVIEHPQTPDMTKYLVRVDGLLMGTRHPTEPTSSNPFNCTRDQLIPICAGLNKQGKHDEARELYDATLRRGLRAQNTEYDVPGSTKKFPDGADFMNPFHMLIMAIAAKKHVWLWAAPGYLFAVLDILFNAIFTPVRESNQLICALSVLGPRWLKLYMAVTPRWRQALTDYWDGWRNEPELSKDVIKYMESL